MSLALAPAVFLAHFLAVYVLVSLACPAGLESAVRPGIVVVTAAALTFYAGFARASRRRRQGPGGTLVFLGSVNMLLCALSAVGTAWVALPALWVAPCAS